MQINRLFEIVYILLDRKHITANELARHFEVSKRTILRDVEILSMTGVPIYTLRGKGGGISLLDGFVLDKTIFTKDEQSQILFGLKSLAATGHGNSNALLSKLSALFQKDNSDWIEVDFSRWGQGNTDNLRFQLLKNSILNHIAIEFEYVTSYGEKSSRKVYPLKLVFKSKSWYIQCFCTMKQDYRTFKLNRMLDVKQTEENFSKAEFSPPSIEDSKSSSDALIQLELEFPPHAAYRVYDEFDESCIEHADNGYLHVFTCLPEDNWLYSFILSFGKDVVILKPEHVKENLIKYLDIK